MKLKLFCKNAHHLLSSERRRFCQKERKYFSRSPNGPGSLYICHVVCAIDGACFMVSAMDKCAQSSPIVCHTYASMYLSRMISPF